MTLLRGPVLLPACPATVSADARCFVNSDFGGQLAIFCCLATNGELLGNVTLESLDRAMHAETTFYACRALRRLVLGEGLYPFIHRQGGIVGKTGNEYAGPGLIIDDDIGFTFSHVETHMFLPTVLTYELSDAVSLQSDERTLRSLYCPPLTVHNVHHQSMFRILCRYLQIWEFEECFNAFTRTLPEHLLGVCYQNYFKLLEPFKTLTLARCPPPCAELHLDYLKFNILGFLSDWNSHHELHRIQTRIIHNLESHPVLLKNMSKQNKFQDIRVSGDLIIDYQTVVNQSLSGNLHVKINRKDPGKKTYKVVVVTTKSTYYLTFPSEIPVFRVAMCMSVAEHVCHSCDRLYPNAEFLGPGETPRVLEAMFLRIQYAPKDRDQNFIFDANKSLARHKQSTQDKQTEPLPELFEPVKHLSLHNFKISVFNTNMVINTKITCWSHTNALESIIDIPRLTNNFVMKKLSVKEPSFTVSVFYSDNLCNGAAININISGDMLHFMFAMGNLRCFLPVKHIFPVSIANWNSTLDLHGLENQYIVRRGRRDVFWTTNFPSVVSSKDGCNVSWFKAATATISKIYGKPLLKKLSNELDPILSAPYARIDRVKNTIFTTLEARNKAQIQTLHKRFVECLVECCSFLRLDLGALSRAARLGAFDFSKRIISHTKSKHECAILGYKKCNLIPKIYVRSKKIRLDELGRNANFMSFVATTGHAFLNLKPQVIRHTIRRLGLHWRNRAKI
ncbi:ORF24 [macacine gammaherpesvirus 12]|uniref:ORF24 n=1 Tax=macacine gammaherpesvirus 12 TaxID=2560571 RepID=A0A0B5CYS5_9GAMA|nr:ORF24 [Macaca nemestrina rhadinovirus 2]AJE29665.1 ORF24 [Macaca nemestrina rhadinovirus 2]